METGNIESWIYTTLANDSTIHGLVADRIYSEVAPKGAVFPCVVFQLLGDPDDLMVVNAKRIWTDARYIIRGIDRAEKYVQTLGNRIDVLFHRANGTYVETCVREQIFQLTEIVDGVQFRHLGGIFRIQSK